MRQGCLTTRRYPNRYFQPCRFLVEFWHENYQSIRMRCRDCRRGPFFRCFRGRVSRAEAWRRVRDACSGEAGRRQEPRMGAVASDGQRRDGRDGSGRACARGDVPLARAAVSAARHERKLFRAREVPRQGARAGARRTRKGNLGRSHPEGVRRKRLFFQARSVHGCGQPCRRHAGPAEVERCAGLSPHDGRTA